MSVTELLRKPEWLGGGGSKKDRETQKQGLRKWATPWRIWLSLGTVDITASVTCRPYGSLPVPAAAIQRPPVLRWLSKGLPQGVPLPYIP